MTERLEKGFFFLVLLILGVYLVLTLWVPPSIPPEGDALDYRLYLSQESAIWKLTPDHYNTSLPHLWDTLRSGFLSWGAGWPRLPNILIFLLFGFFSVWSMQRVFGLNERGARWGTLLLLCTPTFYMQASTCMVDLPAGLGLIVAATLLIHGRQIGKPFPFWIGFSIQWAISFHWWPWAFGAALGLAWFWLWRKEILRQPSLLVAIVLSTFLPYPAFILLRNWMETGNPVFPILNGVFQSAWMSPLRIEEFANAISGGKPGKMPWDALLLPFRLAFRSQPFDYPGGAVLLALGLLLFLPIRVWGVRGKQGELFTAIRNLTLVLLLAWFLTVQNTRFLGVVFFLLVVYSGLVFQHHLSKKVSVWTKRFLLLGFGSYILVFSYMAIGNQSAGVRYFKRGASAEAWLHHELPRYDWVKRINQNFEGKSGSLGLVARTGDGYYLQMPQVFLPHHVFSNFSYREKKRVCLEAESRRIRGLYGNRKSVEELVRDFACFKNFEPIMSSENWTYYEAKD